MSRRQQPGPSAPAPGMQRFKAEAHSCPQIDIKSGRPLACASPSRIAGGFPQIHRILGAFYVTPVTEGSPHPIHTPRIVRGTEAVGLAPWRGP